MNHSIIQRLNHLCLADAKVPCIIVVVALEPTAAGLAAIVGALDRVRHALAFALLQASRAPKVPIVGGQTRVCATSLRYRLDARGVNALGLKPSGDAVEVGHFQRIPAEDIDVLSRDTDSTHACVHLSRGDGEGPVSAVVSG